MCRTKISSRLTFFYKPQSWQLAHIAAKKLLTFKVFLQNQVHKSTSVQLNEICVSKTFVYNRFFNPNFSKQNLFVKTFWITVNWYSLIHTPIPYSYLGALKTSVVPLNEIYLSKPFCKTIYFNPKLWWCKWHIFRQKVTRQRNIGAHKNSNCTT